MDNQIGTPWWRTRRGMVLIGFLAVAGSFLVTEHTAHVLGALPYLLLAACPLMHLFLGITAMAGMTMPRATGLSTIRTPARWEAAMTDAR